MNSLPASVDSDKSDSSVELSGCGKPIRRLAPGGQRPADLLAAFFLAAIVFFLAGAIVAILTALDAIGWYGHWLTLHLVLVGGVSQLILGAAQFFSTAYLATDPPSKSMVRAQLATWNSGTVLLAAGVPADLPVLTDLGGLLLLGGLALFGVSLRRLERRSLQTARWTIRWYYACAASLAVGALIGVAMARGLVWTHGSLLGAHLALNLLGWLGTAIIGTLHTFYPSLTHGLLKHPRLQGPTFCFWLGGVALLALGEAFGLDALGVLGWVAMTIAAGLLTVNIVASARAAQDPISLAARLVGAAQVFLPAGMILALAMLAIEGPDAALQGPWRAALSVLLIGGWIGMTVAGSLLHLLTVLKRVRNLMLAMPQPANSRDIVQATALTVSIAVLALSKLPELAGLGTPATVAALICAAPVAAKILTLAFQALFHTPPKRAAAAR